MSDAFYTKLQATANKIIADKGRDLTLIAENETAADPSKPWEGASALAVESTLAIKGAFVPPNTVRQFGVTALGLGTEFMDLMDMSEQVIIAATGDNDVRDYRTVLDSYQGDRWGIIGIQQLRPGNVGVLSFILVRR